MNRVHRYFHSFQNNCLYSRGKQSAQHVSFLVNKLAIKKNLTLVLIRSVTESQAFEKFFKLIYPEKKLEIY